IYQHSNHLKSVHIIMSYHLPGTRTYIHLFPTRRSSHLLEKKSTTPRKVSSSANKGNISSAKFLAKRIRVLNTISFSGPDSCIQGLIALLIKSFKLMRHPPFLVALIVL